jgi:hypothetical protein
MTPQEVTSLNELYQMSLEFKQRDEEKQANRLELVRMLNVIKKLKIETEKRTLQAQIERLNSL